MTEANKGGRCRSANFPFLRGAVRWARTGARWGFVRVDLRQAVAQRFDLASID